MMVTKQLTDWAVRSRHSYIYNENESFDIIKLETAEGYAFSMENEYNQAASGAVAYLGGMIGTLLFSGVMRTYVLKLSVDHNTWSKESLKGLKAELKGIAVPAYVNGLLTLSMKKNSHNDKTYETMREAANITSRYLQGQGVRMPQECVYCQMGSCDDFDTTPRTGSILKPAHARCVSQKRREMLATQEKRKEKEGYFPGLLMLIPGLLVGSIPVGIAMYLGFYFGYVNLFLYFLIPLIALPFYHRANGKAAFGVLPFIIILTGIVIAALVILGEGIWFVVSYDNRTWEDFISRRLMDAGYISGLLPKMIVYWIGGLLGVVIAYISLLRNGKKRNIRYEAMQLAIKAAEQDMYNMDLYNRQI